MFNEVEFAEVYNAEKILGFCKGIFFPSYVCGVLLRVHVLTYIYRQAQLFMLFLWANTCSTNPNSSRLQRGENSGLLQGNLAVCLTCPRKFLYKNRVLVTTNTTVIRCLTIE